MVLLVVGRVALGIVGVLLVLALAVVVAGTFLPRVPVIGFLGSFVSGQYPLHAALAAVLGTAAGAGLLALGAPRFGGAVAVLAVLALVGTLVVLGTQASAARRAGVPIDWGLALTAIDQRGAPPDLVVEYLPGLELALHLPSGPGPHPVLVWVHGGSWVRGTTADRARTNRWYADRGLAVVAVQYRLPSDPVLPGATLGEAQRHDVARALAWVRGPGAAHGLDPDAVVLGGQSAGATLALSTTAALVGTPRSSLPDGAAGPPPRRPARPSRSTRWWT
ncbi:alpha/beta hydrolase [Actinomycetospora sp. OC33-EN08]|uniref:Alpha/beta hydrolase n=1 Tax=Actinomycetospora aurantiaca TaxID=3129233 RepID=A0ABU8MPK3_9PSEU